MLDTQCRRGTYFVPLTEEEAALRPANGDAKIRTRRPLLAVSVPHLTYSCLGFT